MAATEMIPSSFYETSDGMTPENVRIISYGVPRSGTTFIWQILNDLFPDGGVVKTHNYLEIARDVPVIGTIRDWRDCIVSHWRMGKPNAKKMTSEEIVDWSALCQRWVFIWNYYRLNTNNLWPLRYEQFAGHQNDRVFQNDYVFWSIEKATGTRLDRKRRFQLEAAHNLEANRKLADAVESGYDPKFLIHHNHVHEGEVGTWRRFVEEEDAILFTKLLKPELSAWGYL